MKSWSILVILLALTGSAVALRGGLSGNPVAPAEPMPLSPSAVFVPVGIEAPNQLGEPTDDLLAAQERRLEQSEPRPRSPEKPAPLAPPSPQLKPREQPRMAGPDGAPIQRHD